MEFILFSFFLSLSLSSNILSSIIFQFNIFISFVKHEPATKVQHIIKFSFSEKCPSRVYVSQKNKVTSYSVIES